MSYFDNIKRELGRQVNLFLPIYALTLIGIHVTKLKSSPSSNLFPPKCKYLKKGEPDHCPAEIKFHWR